jgi:hypothetical protein
MWARTVNLANDAVVSWGRDLPLDCWQFRNNNIRHGKSSYVFIGVYALSQLQIRGNKHLVLHIFILGMDDASFTRTST